MKRFFPYFLCLVLLCCHPTVISAQEPMFSDKVTGGSEGGMVGAIESEYNVSPNGQFHYEIPIPAVAGTGGIKPNVSLVYDSSSKEGALGYGFDLAGISLIHRVPSNVVNDGRATAVNFSSTDNFALDGGRLIYCYAKSVSQYEYRTEHASYSRIISTGDRLNPSSFTVETKSGLKYEYKSLAAIAGASCDSTLLWPMTKVIDSKGNYYTVSYNIDTTLNNFYVSRIDYTGNDAMGLTPYARLEFSYLTNVFAPTTYVCGKKVRQSQLLSKVKVYSDNKCVRTFEIEYGLVNSRYFVKKIKEYGTGGAYLNPTTFDWYQPGSFTVTNVNYSTNTAVHKATLTVGDFNGDGMSDFLATPEDKNAGWKGWKMFISKGKQFENPEEGSFHWPDNEVQQVVAGDFNGDGLSDIVVKRYYPTGYYNCDLYLTEKEGTKVKLRFDTCFVSSKNNYSIHRVEVNGDGADDLFLWFHGTNKCNIIRSERLSGKIHPFHYKAERSSSLTFDKVEFGDFNGDGLTDVLNLDKNGCRLLQSDGYGTMSELSTHPFVSSKHHVYPGDFNGDGKTDLLVTGWDDDPNKDGWSSWVVLSSMGNGEFIRNDFPRTFKDTEKEIIVSDINGDGYDDVQGVPRSSGSSMVRPSVYLNNGRGEFIYHAQGGNIYGLDKWRFYTGDFNGDGKIDMLCTSDWSNSNWNGFQLYLMPETPSSLLRSVKDGIGNSVSIEYKYMSDNSVCKKGVSNSDALSSFGMPWPLVSSVSVPDGVGGVARTSYLYGKPLFHKGGKGFICFESFSQKDETTGILSTDSFEVQPDKFVAGVNQSVTSIDGKTLSETVYTNALLYSGTVTSGQKIYSYVPVKKQEKSYEYNSGKTVADVTTTYEYDRYGNITSSRTTSGTLAITLTNKYSNDETRWFLGRLTKAVTLKTNGSESLTKTVEYVYDGESGLLIEECIEPANIKYGLRKTYSHDGYGNIVSSSQKSLDGSTTRTSKSIYDSRGRFLSATISNIGFRQDFDVTQATGLIASSTDCNGIKTTNSYDGLGNLIQSGTPIAKTVSTTGWASGMADAPERSVYFSCTQTTGAPYKIEFYDCLGRILRSVTQSFGNKKVVIDYVYDNQGRLTKTSEPYFSGSQVYWNSKQYDRIGRLVSETDASGNTSSMAYSGLKTISTDALGCTITRNLDVYGNVVSAIDNDGTEIRYSYDVEGNCTKVICGDKEIEIKYDILGNRTRLDDPELGVSTSEYNSFGELIKKTDPYGTTAFTYDAEGRVTTESHDDSTIQTTYDTEWKGAVSEVSVIDTSLSIMKYAGIRYKYDAYGRITEQTTSINRTSFTSSMSYNDRNLVDVLTYPTGVSVRNSYDESGLLKSVADCNSGLVYWELLSLDARGQVEKEKYGNGVVTTTTHDLKRGLTSGISAPGIQNWSYTFDAVGNLKSRKDMTRNLEESFIYDSLHRLSNVKKNGVSTQKIEYDEYGNITYKSNVGSYEYEDGTNRLASIDVSACEPKIWDEVRYNSRGKVSYIKSGTSNLQLQYGPDGNCVQKVEGDMVRYYVGRLFETYVEGRIVTDRNFIYGGGKAVAIVIGDPQTNTSTVQYAHYDHLGSIQALSDCNGRLIEEFSYDAWGMRRNPENWSTYSGNHSFGEIHGFTGNEHLDLFCIVDMRGRLYDPLIGRFISPDPIVQLADFSQGLNRYAYCLNNPLSLVDPSGYSWFSKNWKSIVASIVGIGVSALTLGSGSGLGIAIIAGAAGGASCALTGALLNGSNFGQIAKNTLVGGIVGAAGAFLNFASADPNIFVSIAKHSFSQGWLDGIQGGNAVHGFMMGAVSKIGGAAVDTFSPYTGMVGGLLMNSMLSGVVDELGGGKFANGAVTGSFSYLFNETLHRVQERGDSDDYDSVLANIKKAGGTALLISQADSPTFGPADVLAIVYFAGVAEAELQKLRVHLTYTLTDKDGMIYVGRTSGYGTPTSVLKRRFYCHHMRLLGFKNPKIDCVMWGPEGKVAIRGREQRLMDYYGGVGSPKLANKINGIWDLNPNKQRYLNASDFYFGKLPDNRMYKK